MLNRSHPWWHRTTSVAKCETCSDSILHGWYNNVQLGLIIETVCLCDFKHGSAGVEHNKHTILAVCYGIA